MATPTKNPRDRTVKSSKIWVNKGETTFPSFSWGFCLWFSSTSRRRKTRTSSGLWTWPRNGEAVGGFQKSQRPQSKLWNVLGLSWTCIIMYYLIYFNGIEKKPSWTSISLRQSFGGVSVSPASKHRTSGPARIVRKVSFYWWLENHQCPNKMIPSTILIHMKNHSWWLPGLVNVYKTMERSTMLLTGKSTISMAIFKSYVKLPEGRKWRFTAGKICKPSKRTRRPKCAICCRATWIAWRLPDSAGWCPRKRISGFLNPYEL